MAYTRIIHNIQYVEIHPDNDMKLLTLEDNVYFTLRDIFLKISCCDICVQVHRFNSQLTNNINYEDRNQYFVYSNALNNKDFMNCLHKLLNSIYPSDFYFEKISDTADNEEKKWYYDMNILMKFDDWWMQFEKLRHLIKIKLKELLLRYK